MHSARYQSIATDLEYAAASARSRQEVVLIYKHSTLCELCAAAKDQLLSLTAEGDPPVYEVIVQTARPLSNMIARTLGIRHESPQAILLQNEKPVFDTSHRGVTARGVRAAIRRLS